MDERRSYVRKSLHSTVTVFERESGRYIGLLADFSDEGIMITSSVQPIEVGQRFHYVMLVQTGQHSNVGRAEVEAVSVWTDCTNPSLFGTGFKLLSASPNAQAILDDCHLKQA